MGQDASAKMTRNLRAALLTFAKDLPHTGRMAKSARDSLEACGSEDEAHDFRP